MTRRPIRSSWLASAGHDPATKTLETEFITGAIYRFLSVPDHLHRALWKAPSAGAFFNAFVKGRYPAVPVR